MAQTLGFRVNRYRLVDDGMNLNEIFATLLSSASNINLWSYEALKGYYTGIAELMIEYCDERKEEKKSKTKCNNFIKRLNNSLLYIPKDRDRLIRFIYETILKGDGLGILHNFGMANKFGDPIAGNPGHTSLRSTQINDWVKK